MNKDYWKRFFENKNLHWKYRYRKLLSLQEKVNEHKLQDKEKEYILLLIKEQFLVMENYKLYTIEKKAKSEFEFPERQLYKTTSVIEIKNFVPFRNKIQEDFLFTEEEANYIIEKLNHYYKGHKYLFIKKETKLQEELC